MNKIVLTERDAQMTVAICLLGVLLVGMFGLTLVLSLVTYAVL